MQKPWWRKGTGCWYVTVKRKQINLGSDPDGEGKVNPPRPIADKWHALMQRHREVEDRALSFCIGEYVKSLEGCSPKTLYRSRYFLDMFVSEVGDLKVSKLKKHHVTEFLKGKSWKPNSVHAVLTRIEACLNYCEREDWIPKNPLKGKIEKPTQVRREEIMSPADRRRLLDAAEGCFRSILTFLSGTGCRPIEARFARIEKCDLDKGVIMVRNKSRKKTGAQERAVFLSTAMIEFCRTLIGDRTDGWLLRNSFGNQWTQTALEHRLQKLCEKLGITHGAQLYSFRHGFASELINEKRMNPAMVAIQLGHTDLKMLLKTYLHSDHEAMRKALDE